MVKNPKVPDTIKCLKKFGEYAFSNCSGMTSLTISDGVGTFAYYTFRGCTGLTSVELPVSMTQLLSASFYNCSSLTSITYKGTKAQWEAIRKIYDDENWNAGTGAYTVYCTDGTIPKE